MEKKNINLFINLNNIRTEEKDITETEHQFYYIISDKIENTFSKGDIVQNPCGIFYCVYSCENVVPVDWEDIRVSIGEIANNEIHINRKGDILKDKEGIVAIPLQNYEWYDLGEFYLSYESLNRMVIVENEE